MEALGSRCRALCGLRSIIMRFRLRDHRPRSWIRVPSNPDHSPCQRERQTAEDAQAEYSVHQGCQSWIWAARVAKQPFFAKCNKVWPGQGPKVHVWKGRNAWTPARQRQPGAVSVSCPKGVENSVGAVAKQASKPGPIRGC